MVEWSSHKRPQYLPEIRSGEKLHTLSWIHLRCVGEEVAPWLCMCCDGVVGEGRQRGRRERRKAGRGLQSFPGRALSHGSFSSWDSVNRQWLNGDEKGAGAGRTAQREAALHENCAPVKALFWLVLRAHKQTVLFIGSITVTPLVVKHICFSFSTSDKTCDLLCMHRLLHLLCCLYSCLLYPPPPE